jgi:hypothetical protein
VNPFLNPLLEIKKPSRLYIAFVFV